MQSKGGRWVGKNRSGKGMGSVSDELSRKRNRGDKVKENKKLKR